MSGCGIRPLAHSFTCPALAIDPPTATDIRPQVRFILPDQVLEVREVGPEAFRTLTQTPIAVVAADPVRAAVPAAAALAEVVVFPSGVLHPARPHRPALRAQRVAIVPVRADCNPISGEVIRPRWTSTRYGPLRNVRERGGGC